MLDFISVAEETALKEYIKENLFDYWAETPIFGYKYLDNKQKGEYGEQFAKHLFHKLKYKVEPPLKYGGGHDMIVNGIKTEIKFSVSHTNYKKQCIVPGKFTLNHVSVGKDWERLVFIGINPDINDSIAMFMNKEDFKAIIADDAIRRMYFDRQQGGKDGDNDDYLSAATKLTNLLNSQYMKDIVYF